MVPKPAIVLALEEEVKYAQEPCLHPRYWTQYSNNRMTYPSKKLKQELQEQIK